MPQLAIVFDLDGTLLDTLADIGHAANRVLEQNNFPPHPLDAYRQFVGEGVTVLFELALPARETVPATIVRCVDGFREVYGSQFAVHTRPYEGIEELLDELTRRQIPLAVLSNKPHEITQRCVHECLSSWSFQSVLGQRPEVARKPDPAGAVEIAAHLGLPQSCCVYVGDTAIDMKTATSAGMLPVGVLWGFRHRDELLASGAKHLLEHPMQLLDILDDSIGDDSIGTVS